MPRLSPEMPLKLASSAFLLFSRQGIRQVGVEAIATQAGVTKGSLYWHFQSKQEVIHAACAHYYRIYHQRLASEIAPCMDPVARIERAIRLSVRICLLDRQNRIFTLEIFTLSLYDKAIRQGWLEFYDSVRNQYIAMLEEARAAGQLSFEDATRVANRLLESMEGAKLRALYEPRICSGPEEELIVQNLLSIAGISPKKKRRKR
jgi:AcrR family transcriptional regulator